MIYLVLRDCVYVGEIGWGSLLYFMMRDYLGLGVEIWFYNIF